ncbi:MAG: hypothetical protein IID40_08270 [Planctomycetes bacterium]|nr:hypothetical protein [Planctomycetota bacterium]
MSHEPPPTAARPPVQPGELYFTPEPSSWPKVIGIISIVLGSLGILGGINGALSPFYAASLAKFMPGQSAEVMAMVKEFAVWTVAGSLVAIGLAGLLLAAGIALVKQRPQAVGRCRLWAVLKILFAIANTVLQYQIQSRMMQAQQDSGNFPAGMADLMVWTAVVMPLAWALPYPGFLLIWFGRSKIKLEVANWG